MSKQKQTVVVVDDNTTVRALFKRGTEDLAIDLVSYGSAAEAMAYLKDHRPNLLFLDIIMPDKDGLSFLRELRNLPLHQDTPVIMITSKDYMQDRTLAKALGALEFITKPMSIQAISDIIRQHIQGISE